MSDRKSTTTVKAEKLQVQQEDHKTYLATMLQDCQTVEEHLVDITVRISKQQPKDTAHNLPQILYQELPQNSLQPRKLPKEKE